MMKSFLNCERVPDWAHTTPSHSPARLRCAPRLRRLPPPHTQRPGPAARARVPAALAGPGPAAWTPTGRPGSGRGRLGRQARGQVRCGAAGCLLPGDGHGGRGRVSATAPGEGALSSRARWHRWGSRGREEGGGVGSVRPTCSGPEGSPPAARPPGRPPAPPEVPGATAARARQLRPASLLPTPGLREVRLCLPHGTSAPGRLLPWREDWVWTRPEARWSHNLNLGRRSGKSSPRQLRDPEHSRQVEMG
ncbi:unnamed protein product [Nyctereutes procyonoides]|uniref:(raccoon dog) hypothetical protein n=1 Tax=Nyctereutes procyonoides TaxID=34880 RepID=A0A811ZDK9_NYCPR|nr:unnamed protein product [Nyctereutes procyonoides]